MEDEEDFEVNPFGGGGSQVARTTVYNAKFEVEKFDGTNSSECGSVKLKMC